MRDEPYRKLSAEVLMLLNCGVGEHCWESLDCKRIKPVYPKGNQSWIFTGRNDAKAETPVLCPPDTKSWLIGKDSDAGRDGRQEEKETTEDEMSGWHHRLDGCESEWTPGVGDGQGGLACCSSWGHKESDRTERLNWTELGLGVQSETGQRLTEFCQENMLVIANTLFQTQETTLHMMSLDGQHWNQIDYVLCSWRWRSSIQLAKTRLGADCGSDHELLIAKFRLQVETTTRQFKNDLNRIPYDYTVEVMNRFKGLNLIECLKNYGRRFMTL